MYLETHIYNEPMLRKNKQKNNNFVVTYFQADWCTQTARNYVEPVNLIRTSDFQTVVASFVYSLHQMASERTVGS